MLLACNETKACANLDVRVWDLRYLVDRTTLFTLSLTEHSGRSTDVLLLLTLDMTWVFVFSATSSYTAHYPYRDALNLHLYPVFGTGLVTKLVGLFPSLSARISSEQICGMFPVFSIFLRYSNMSECARWYGSTKGEDVRQDDTEMRLY